MTNAWNDIDEAMKKFSTGKFLRLADDGDKAVVVFLGDPKKREIAYIDGGIVPAADAPKGAKTSMKIEMNVAHITETGMEVKIYSMGIKTYSLLKNIRNKYGLDAWSFEITRSGKAKSTDTSYSILPETKLSPEEKEELMQLELFDLDTGNKATQAVAPKAKAAPAPKPQIKKAAPPPKLPSEEATEPAEDDSEELF